MPRIRRIAVVALAGRAVAARAAYLGVVRPVGMALAYPAYAAADFAVVIHVRYRLEDEGARPRLGCGISGTVRTVGGEMPRPAWVITLPLSRS
jgi:hypothetical protein